ncbi:MAG: cysteine synthase family protein [Clostridiales bacterium]|jgi:cysteine synthase A|nr:cysteine synthase family protein [Clostridiales bacterium]MDR2751698.1 cysteine synthase family protein [Clostridiales bacterium]
MSRIFSNITELIGKTPLVRLNRLEKEYGLNAEIVVKLEFFNPTQNVKERIALSMVEGAEERGDLKPGGTIIDLSSGNTSISLAAVAAAKGYKFHAYLQDSASNENKQILKAFGADYETIFTNPRLFELVAEYGGDAMKAFGKLLEEGSVALNAFATNQMESLDNPKAHYRTTGPEIWEDTDGKIDFFVTGAGTGGTILGAGGYLKEKNPEIQIVAYQPGVNSRPFENQAPEQPELLGVHPISGVPFIAPLLRDKGKLWDELIDVEAPDAYDAARAAAKHEGILVGESSGAALYTAIQLAKRPENAGKRIVALLADSGVHYLSTPLFEL